MTKNLSLIRLLTNCKIACSPLCGCEAVYQINTILATDPAICKAWGRAKCADQSTIQQTLSACTQTNIAQMQTVLKTLLQKHSPACHHDFSTAPLILGIYLTAPHLYEGGERKLHQIRVRCVLGEKSKAKRQEQAAIRALKTSKVVVADEWE